MTEKTDGPVERNTFTSDNSYAGGPNIYAVDTVAELCHRTPARIRQIARQFGIGSRFGKKSWRFTLEEIMLLRNHLRKERTMRNVSPKAVQQGSGPEDTILPYLRAQLDKLRQDGFRTLQDVWTGLNNRVSKEAAQIDRRIYLLEERIKKLEGGRGRGVSCFSGPALPTLDTYAAEAA